MRQRRDEALLSALRAIATALEDPKQVAEGVFVTRDQTALRSAIEEFEVWSRLDEDAT